MQWAGNAPGEARSNRATAAATSGEEGTMPFKKGDPNINRKGRIPKKQKGAAPPPPRKAWTSDVPVEGRRVKGLRMSLGTLEALLSGRGPHPCLSGCGRAVACAVDHERGGVILFFMAAGGAPVGPDGTFTEISPEWRSQESSERPSVAVDRVPG